MSAATHPKLYVSISQAKAIHAAFPEMTLAAFDQHFVVTEALAQ